MSAPGSTDMLSELLRAPEVVARRCVHDPNGDRELRRLTLVSIAAIVCGGALFGMTLGAYRGGLQMLFAAVKIPAAGLLTLACTAPAYYALSNVVGRRWPMQSVVALGLSSTARASLVLVASVPVLWFLIDVGAGYHMVALWASAVYGLAGVAALGVVYRALAGTPHRLWVLAVMVALFGVVGGQTAWSLRPFLGRPSQAQVPFLRAPDGVFVERVWTSGRSAMGHYDSDGRDARAAERGPAR